MNSSNQDIEVSEAQMTQCVTVLVMFPHLDHVKITLMNSH